MMKASLSLRWVAKVGGSTCSEEASSSFQDKFPHNIHSIVSVPFLLQGRNKGKTLSEFAELSRSICNRFENSSGKA